LLMLGVGATQTQTSVQWQPAPFANYWGLPGTFPTFQLAAQPLSSDNRAESRQSGFALEMLSDHIDIVELPGV
jgi:hypothetical protein